MAARQPMVKATAVMHELMNVRGVCRGAVHTALACTKIVQGERYKRRAWPAYATAIDGNVPLMCCEGAMAARQPMVKAIAVMHEFMDVRGGCSEAAHTAPGYTIIVQGERYKHRACRREEVRGPGLE